MRIAAIIILLFIWASCESPANKDILNPEVRYVADTMFSRRKSKITAKLDSLCLIKTQKYYESARDSLIELEFRRIEELSQKIKPRS